MRDVVKGDLAAHPAAAAVIISTEKLLQKGCATALIVLCCYCGPLYAIVYGSQAAGLQNAFSDLCALHGIV